jgi:hypothetical protein
MKIRLLRFFAWLLGGVVGTLLLPAALLFLAGITSGSFIGKLAAALYGLSIYLFVPLGFSLSFLIAVLSLRWNVDQPSPENESPSKKNRA